MTTEEDLRDRACAAIQRARAYAEQLDRAIRTQEPPYELIHLVGHVLYELQPKRTGELEIAESFDVG